VGINSETMVGAVGIQCWGVSR